MIVHYVFDENLIQECNRLPVVNDRASLVHNLIEAYKLLEHMKVVHSLPATYSELKEFHSELYLDHLKKFTDVDEEYMSTTQDEEYGIGYDCAPVSNMYELVSTLAGGSITAAKCLVLGLTTVAINWCGGWHHAHRFGADGFCYVNDIVIAINALRKKFPKILYIDLDVHHGNGVQDAFNLSNSVFTLSFHKYEAGFYPGTGGLDDIGTLTGKGYSCNVPLKAAYSDETINYVFEKVFEQVDALFAPDAIVVQCGADALARDPHGGASITTRGYCTCVRRVLDKRKPTLLLGGGGYKFPNAARLWASLTALAIGVDLDQDIPEHDNWPSYGPDYTLDVEPPLARDTNTRTYLDHCLAQIIKNLDDYLRNKPSCYGELQPKRHNVLQNAVIEQKIGSKNKESKETVRKQQGKFTKDATSENLKRNEDVYEFTDD